MGAEDAGARVRLVVGQRVRELAGSRVTVSRTRAAASGCVVALRDPPEDDGSRGGFLERGRPSLTSPRGPVKKLIGYLTRAADNP